MAELKKIDVIDAKECAQIHINAYSEAPWNEELSIDEVERYIIDFLNSDTRRAYALIEGENIIGVALGLIIPGFGASYFRVEDICIAPRYQRQGYGGRFVELLTDRLRLEGCDSILLGTQRGYPSHQFYLKNGFVEIESVLLYRGIEK